MSFMEPGKTEVQATMMSVADTLAQKAATLKAFAESFSEATEEEFETMLGNQYSGAGTMRQWIDQVNKACEIRPSDLSQFERAVTEAFARCQRESAEAAAEDRQRMLEAEEASRPKS